MTDHYAVVNTEDLPQVAQTDWVCAECGRAFDSAQALAGHRSAHQNDKQPCPDCGALYIPGPGMARHRQTQHGAAKGNGQKAKGVSGNAAQRKFCPECRKPIRAKDLQRHLRNVHKIGVEPLKSVLEPEQEADWNVDDIFSSVVGLMFPNGVIPVPALLPLLRWRHATDEMLQEVRDGG